MIITGIVIYLVLFFGLMIYLFKKAPEGYQDSEGFHFKAEQTKSD